MAETKIFFATDVHGSELCFKKFINAGKFYGNANVLILGGDMTGKSVVPFVETGGKYKINYLGGLVTCESESEFKEFFARVASMGYYPYKTNLSEMEEVIADKKKMDELFHRLMRETLQRWVAYAEQKMEPTTKCYFMPGNDDPPEIYDGWNSSRVLLFDNQTGMLDDKHEMLALGITNRTPWNTHRETDEPELEKILENLVSKMSQVHNSVFCIHCPPYGTKIDMAPALSADMKTKQHTIPVGSTAVRSVIEKYQPLIALHGHIHESPGVVKLGKTQCVNAGSEYQDGVLRGAVVVLSEKEVKSVRLTTG